MQGWYFITHSGNISKYRPGLWGNLCTLRKVCFFKVKITIHRETLKDFWIYIYTFLLFMRLLHSQRTDIKWLNIGIACSTRSQCCLMGEGKWLSYCLSKYCIETEQKMVQSLAVWMHANICVNVCTMCVCVGGQELFSQDPIREQNKAKEQEVKVCLMSAVLHRNKANKWYLPHR